MKLGRTAAVLALLLLTSLALSHPHAAQDPPRELSAEQLFPGATFSPAIPSPEALLRVRAGSRPLRHAEVLRYFDALIQASPRVKLVEYARTYEDRPLVVLAISDEATIARLDAFRAEHAAALDPRGHAATDGPRDLDDMKAVAWMAYGIHGDELSSTDAAVWLAYRLVAGEDERARKLRHDLVVLVDPCENPDGRERFLAQNVSFAHAVASPDGEDLSHTNVWPWGRGNHYLFDLNRDWFTMVEPESARSAVIATFAPQLMVCSHEMESDDTYLFSPPRHPFNPFLPQSERRWWDVFAADQARALDARGYAYYTREWNEEFFPGYGSSWASYQGSIGILYEMSGTGGTLVRQRPGTVRTFAQAVEHQVTSSVANLETLSEHRAEVLRDTLSARRDAIRRGSEGPIRAWIVPPGPDPERTDALARLLRRQGIDVLRAASSVRAAGLTDARTGRSSTAVLPAGTWMIPLDQPAGALAHVILDPHVPMSAEFLREEREYLERGRGSRLYDTTSWSLLLSYGVEAYWAGAKPVGDWKADEPPAPQGRVDRPASVPYGYVFDGVADRAMSAVANLLERGVAVRVAERSFRVEDVSLGRGAILVKREGNPENLRETLEDVARRFQLVIHALPTAKATEGPDLGGEYFHPLVAPRVGIFTGMPVSPSAYGALWHLFDRVVPLRFTGLDVAQFQQADLGRYNVLVFPPTFAPYRAILGDAGIEKLKRWVEDGGTVIGLGGGAEFLADKETKLTRTHLRRQALDRYPPVVLGPGPEVAEAAGPLRASGIRAPEGESKDRGEQDTAGRRDGQEKQEKKKEKDEKVARPSPAEIANPYDVAPVIGPGAGRFEPRSLASWLKPLLPPGRDKPETEDLERADERLRRFGPHGTFLTADLDPISWLAWGLPPRLDVWLDAEDTLVAEPPVQVVARFADLDRLHLGGLLWPEAAGRIARTAYCTREDLGRGQIILFLDEPTFRGWTLGTTRLFLNAVLYGPGLGTRWSAPW